MKPLKVKAVTAYVALPVLHVSPKKYWELGTRLVNAVPCETKVFDFFPLKECWAYNVRGMPPAQPTPSDRYASPEDFVLSNIVQHQRTTWAMLAAAEDPAVDVFVWLDYGILKQGDFTGRPVTEQAVREFIERVGSYHSGHINFPGIWAQGPISDTGDNWRFCGSTHIWPRCYLPLIHKAYQDELLKFVNRTRTVPNDLPIWAHTERDHSLPFRWYAANHDASQLTNYPEAPQ